MSDAPTQDRRFAGYDIIGDVHGCGQTLARLLEQLGYQQRQGVYQHRDRQAIFVGDIVDRGPRIREALHLVYDMVQGGHAQMVMGNHEYNAIGYCTRARPGTGHIYLREHDDRHSRLIHETLEQFEAYPHEWREFLDWFKQLPLFLEFDDFRVVHACWDGPLIEAFKQRYQGNRVTMDFIHESVVKGSFAGQVMDHLTRGTDVPLPEGVVIQGRDGFARRWFRAKFWAENPQTYGDVVFQPDPLPAEVAALPIKPEHRRRLVQYPTDAPPVFFGHYWLEGRPRPLKHNVCCLDYSAVKYGRLVAYRFDHEPVLDPDKFVWVYVDRPRES